MGARHQRQPAVDGKKGLHCLQTGPTAQYPSAHTESTSDLVTQMNEPYVHELDMPPMGYFQIPLDAHGTAVTIIAHVICANSFTTQEQAESFSKLGVGRVHQELLTLGGGII